MSNQIQNPNAKKKYDLAERTAKFGEAVIEFVQCLLDSPINRPLVNQIVRSGTSIGANYMEADGAEMTNLKYQEIFSFWTLSFGH